jgi:hypothetical protein
MTTRFAEGTMLRGLACAGLVLAVSACTPDLPKSAPVSVVRAEFDPTTAKIPLPNDLALPPFNSPNSVCPAPGNMAAAGSPPQCAQAELLTSFNGQFPSDQEVAITIDFVQTNFDAAGKTTEVAPDLDLTSFTPTTFFIAATSGAGQGEVPIEPITAADYVKGTDHGTLTIHHQGHAPWPEGAYAVLVRGGPSGVKTKDAVPIAVGPSQVFSLVEQGLDMTDPKNLGLLKAKFGSTIKALEQGTQLNLLIAYYKATAFPIADTRFPHQELAILTTFKVGAAVTNVTIDPARGLVPLPIDLLRDPAKGKLTPLAACTLAASKLSADGTCASPAAAGFLALDGFSTTGAILGPTSDLIQAATVTPTSLMLYELPVGGAPVQVPPSSLILEPCEFTSACGSPTALSPVIAIQPAGATKGDPSSVFRSKPLKDNTDYAVIMTTAIHDKAGKPIGPGTVAQVLRFTNPVNVGGHSALQGIDDATTAQLEKMRLQPVFAALAAAGTDSSKVAMAYTFHTQTILSQAVQLAALPYTTALATALPGAVTGDKASIITKYGAGNLPSSNIADIFETDITTFNALDPASGAFLPDPTQAAAETIHVLIATPTVANTPACTGGLAPFGKCAPLMVFRHGLGRGRIDMLAIADAYAKAGMVTVAIDAAKHGDRAFCTSGTTGALSGCLGGGACTTALPAGAQGDANPPGTCAAGFVKRGLDGTLGVNGIPVVSGNYLVSANFFRTRDTMRQDLIDESQLIRAMAFAPSGGLPTGHKVFDHMAPTGVIIDPATIYYSGQSLGSIQGTMDVATNPRISKAVFNVGGGSIVDIFTNAPAFADSTNALLAGLGIFPGTPAFLQFLVVAKTVLDPADPINFAGHLTSNTLPNLLPPLGGNVNGSVPQAAKKILTQIAYCDNTVPNPFNLIHSSNIGVGPTPAVGAAFFTPGATGTFQLFVNTGFDPSKLGQDCATTGSGGTVTHGFLLNFTAPTLTAKAQADAAAFVTAPTDAAAKQLSVETP